MGRSYTPSRPVNENPPSEASRQAEALAKRKRDDLPVTKTVCVEVKE